MRGAVVYLRLRETKAAAARPRSFAFLHALVTPFFSLLRDFIRCGSEGREWEDAEKEWSECIGSRI